MKNRAAVCRARREAVFIAGARHPVPSGPYVSASSAILVTQAMIPVSDSFCARKK
jgi:hypothetical protein